MNRLSCFFAFFFCITLTSYSQQMQEFNQLYAERERANALKAAKKAVIDAADAGTPGQAYQKARTAADESLHNESPSLASQVAADVTNPASETSNAIAEASVLPNFTSLFGNSVLVPKIELVGTTNFNSEKNILYGEIRAFTSVISPKQSTNVNLFFPETSAYGITTSFNVLPLKEVSTKKENNDEEEINWLCVYGSMSYLGKSLSGIKKNDAGQSDTTRFTTDFTHMKLGIQLIPIVNFISIYGDINFLAPLANRDKLLQYNPGMKAGFSNFWNVGAKFFLAKGADKPLKLYLDLSCIIVDQVTQTLYSTKDPVITKIAVGSSFRF